MIYFFIKIKVSNIYDVIVKEYIILYYWYLR